MKNIKDITVKVTYTVALSDVKVSDRLYEALCNSYDECFELGSDAEYDNEDACKASEWLSDNIKKEDAMEWRFEIEDMTIEE